jgi:hypothetical protein
MRVTHFATVFAALSLLFAVDSGRASSQTIASASDAQAKSRVIAASFSKFKSLSVEKRGVKKEKYLKVESTPAVRSPENYSGTYEMDDLGFAIHLRVDRSGKVEGDGYEPLNSDPAIRRVFTLRSGKIEGAFLAATKVYAGGNTERLEGAFLNRATFESPTDKGTIRFGLGTLGRAIQVSGNTYDKFFYDLKSQ